MGRPRKLTLDFFLHDATARNDRQIASLCRKHGNDGYAAYFIILEMLCQEEGMTLNLTDWLDVEHVVVQCNLRDEKHLYKIIETCTAIGLFDRQMWESERVLLSHGLLKRYEARLTERQQEAERKKRKREADALSKRIADLRNCPGGQKSFPPGQLPEKTGQPRDPDPETDPNPNLKKDLSRSNACAQTAAVAVPKRKRAPESEPERERNTDAISEPAFRRFVTGKLKPTCKGNLTAYVNAALRNDRESWLSEYHQHLENRSRDDPRTAELTNRLDCVVNRFEGMEKSSAGHDAINLRRANFRRAWDSYPDRKTQLEVALVSQPELGLCVKDGELCEVDEVAA